MKLVFNPLTFRFDWVVNKIAEIVGLQLALDEKVDKTTTVNGQALSADVEVTAITGNAGTATKLATSRNINGVAFDGTANITINAVDSTAREAAITAGTTAQYWRGDKTWQTLNQAAVAGLTTGSSPVFSNLTVNNVVYAYNPSVATQYVAFSYSNGLGGYLRAYDSNGSTHKPIQIGSTADIYLTPSGGKVSVGTTAPKSALHVVGLPVYANNAAAVAGGLTAGAFYRTGADPDPVCVVH